MYAKFKDVLTIEMNDNEKFSIPMYFKTRIDSQCCSFILTGSLIKYPFTVMRYVFADRRFISESKGGFICSSNKRRDVDSVKSSKYYSEYVFNNLKTGEDYKEIAIQFSFTEKTHLVILNKFLSEASKKAYVSSKHYEKVDNKWIEMEDKDIIL